MSFTFDPELGDALSQLRSALNDTVEGRMRWTNAQLGGYITQSGSNVYEAAGLALDLLATRYAFVPDVQVGNKRMSGSQVYAMLTAHAKRLRALATTSYGGAAMPYAAGLSLDELDTDYRNTDLPRPPSGAYALDSYPLGRDPRECE